ncbi:MAG: DUF2804 family protein [Spirochaetes bacterium]|nr:DUF2804 family protein [Spirochaetota bacterium]
MYGRFSAPPGQINMLDVDRPFHYPMPRIIKDWRLKEWTAFRFGDARRFMFAALYNAKAFSLSLFAGYDRETRRSFGFQRLLPGGGAKFPASFDGADLSCHSFGTTLSFKVDQGAGIVRLSVERTAHMREKRIRGAFTFSLNPRQCAPQSVCLPLGLNRAMYSTKILMPMSGELELADERIGFDSPDSMGIIDDHKGFYPYNMKCDWVTGFGLDGKDRRVGFNLTNNQVRDQDVYNENCVWINSRVFALPPVKVTRPQGASGVWHVQDTEGMVDLAFTPDLPHRIKADLGIAGCDYDGPFGSFKGFLKTPDGERIEVECLYGMGEKKLLRI